jgi:hypothetical protein
LDETPPSGWRLVHNQLFRYTLTIPEDWYSNMRPEGGEFTVFDPVASQERNGAMMPGGVWISFSARLALKAETGGLNLFPEERLGSPNTNFGGLPGVIWEEGSGEDLARVIRAAFIKDGVLFEAYAGIKADYPTQSSIDAAAADVTTIINSMRPY